jgi:hypothetical protein
MSMQSPRERLTGLASGTFEAEAVVTDPVVEAHRLACEVERLLLPRPDESEAYGVRLARALAQSLIDQLAELSRDRARTKVA